MIISESKQENYCTEISNGNSVSLIISMKLTS